MYVPRFYLHVNVPFLFRCMFLFFSSVYNAQQNIGFSYFCYSPHTPKYMFKSSLKVQQGNRDNTTTESGKVDSLLERFIYLHSAERL